MSWLPHLWKKEPGRAKDPRAELRQVPIQPSDTPEGFIFLGEELGHVRCAERVPKPGELTVIVGDDQERLALAGAAPGGLENPVFRPGGCKCKCTSGGLIFYLTPVRWTTNLIVIRASDGVPVYQSVLPDVLNGQGIAVDPDPPHNLYILDNRYAYETLQTSGSPTGQNAEITWFHLVTYRLTGAEYEFDSAEVMPGGTNGNTLPTETPVVGTFSCNGISVIDGTVYFSMLGPPAFFRTWDGSEFGQLILQENGDDAPYRVQGEVVQVATRPGPRSSRFVATLDGEMIQFTADGTIQKVEIFTESNVSEPANAVAMCNRVYYFNGNQAGRDEDGGNFEPGGGGEEG